MAIYKRGRYWWMEVFVGAGRRRVQKSTGCEDEASARIADLDAQEGERKA
ncbi:MAG: hypothetical protein K6F50_08665 [Kiritimatiellae bacterium]|nr:hypothetical protein [Kiritimatiellia bacterium]